MDPENLETTETVESNSPVSTDNSSAGNPAWQGMLSELPAEFHQVVKPHLEKWDKTYQDQSTEFSQFKKQYEGVDLNLYQSGKTLLEMLEKDPVTVFNRLEASLVTDGKLSPREAKAAVQELKQQTQSQDPDEQNYEDPSVAALRQQQEALAAQQQKFTEYMTSQAEKAEESNFTNYITAELSRLGLQQGAPDTQIVLNNLATQVALNQQPNMQAAFDQYNAMAQQIRNTPLAGASAPLVTPSNGGLPSSGQPIDPSTLEGKELANYFKSQLDLMKG